MRANNETPPRSMPLFRPAGFFVLRSPLLPLDDLLGWGEGLEAPGTRDSDALAAAIAKDCRRLETRLREFVSRPHVREALFLASPSLDEALSRWLVSGNGADADKNTAKVRRTLVKYLYRMTARSTPFGLFAGCSVGHIDSASSLELPARALYTRHTRLDMHYLGALTLALASEPSLREELHYEPNSSLYRCGDQFRYAEARVDGEIRQYHLVSTEATDYLDATLERARPGARLGELAEALADADPDVTFDQAHEYVTELVDGQLLVSELEPSATGAEPTHDLVTTLRATRGGSGIANILADVATDTERLDSAGVGNPPERYRELAERMARLPSTPQLDKLFQVDLFKPPSGLKLGPAEMDEMARGIRLLARISSRPERRELKEFRERFVARYGTRTVPLAIALDEDVGLGFGTGGEAVPMLQGLPFPEGPENHPTWTRREHELLRRVLAVKAGGLRELSITETDAVALDTGDERPIPDLFAVVARLAAASADALARGDYRIVIDGIVANASQLLGRFCHGDEELRDHVTGLLRGEEACRPDAIFAEIVHLPEGHLGNVVLRPRLRPHEIEYLGRSTVAAEFKLRADELVLSVRDGRLILYSPRLEREIVPCLSSAVNTRISTLPLYRLLGAMGEQRSKANWTFRWGVLDFMPALPRVTSGRLVLSRARWRLTTVELRRFGTDDLVEQFRVAQALREEFDWPRWIVLEDGDNELLVDLDNPLSVEAFAHLVRARETCILTEHLPAIDDFCVTGPEGRFAHQLVVPFLCLPREQTCTLVTKGSLSRTIRTFPPGSQWLYAKIYTGPSTAEQILSGALPSLLDRIRAEGIERWFFIRYGDPEWHIRLRFEGEPGRLCGTILSMLNEWAAPLLASGKLWKLQLDTYEREVERYGGEAGVQLSETLFHHDSETVLAILHALPREPWTEDRWRLALWGVHALLVDFGFTLRERHDIATAVNDGFAAEFRDGSRALQDRWLGAKYRAERSTLLAWLEHRAVPTDLTVAGAAFSARAAASARAVHELRKLAEHGKLDVSLAELAKSHAHMHVNRMLRAAARQQEFVIYNLLARFYRSQLARRDKVSV